MKYNVWVSKEDVRKAIKEIDPEGVDRQRSKVVHRRVYEFLGPGHIYHLDGNDKLKRWGLCIHGCVDGFNRKILWLVASSTNNGPLVIGNCFLQCIKKPKILPVVLRMDKGRENIFCEDLQLFFTGKDDIYTYAASTRNQRIESFWSRLKKFRTNWWIDFISRMVNEEVQLETHVECVLFCFLPIIQLELNDVVKTWNMSQSDNHLVHLEGNQTYYLPETVGYSKMELTVSEEYLTIAEDIVGMDHGPLHHNKTVHELLICYVHIHNIETARDVEIRIEMYVELLRYLDSDGFLV